MITEIIKKWRYKNVTLNNVLHQLSKEKNYSSRKNYLRVLNYIEEYYKIISINNITQKLIDDFDSRLTREGFSGGTINLYLVILKSAINYISKTYGVKLDKIKLPKHNIAMAVEKSLDKSELQRMYKWWEEFKPKTNPEKRKKEYIGLFLVSYLCNGANFFDLMQLTYNDDYFSSNGTVFTFRRSKTNAEIFVPITSYLKNIVEYMG